ncbi:hypothetical protein AA101099_0176 [Neoasaia chiangmaiensis NBRC 101099]|uniref:Uncharacterized protein n=1 Tax=Neoasaia chiangmaiensis TaxID=320497 RepID=A0A1U9KPT9_9PROT|nr:MFS transporter [Neoasaia chiangmaiensis]AQS87841.1 hypothetical protein A0U93_07720 [Neoasaia chiangmaiensis]GBR35899.1 hypothetical protein AA101099_0176 [Neoasaia chiangmaiensis NBRC 101099]GEN14460.1 MFS transporter [Neoasaia chiangmaiensis]
MQMAPDDGRRDAGAADGARVGMARLVLILLMIAGCVSYADRSALAIAGMAIRGDLGLSYVALGWGLSSFAWGYLLFQLPAGILSDRLGGRLLLGGGLVFWSAAQIASGFMHGATGLFVSRLFLGLGETPLFLAGTRILTLWYPPARRATAIGMFNASASLGPAIAPPILVTIMHGWGWRSMFVTLGLVGVVLGLTWWAIYRDPSTARAAGPEEVARPTPVGASLGATLGAIVRQPAAWVSFSGFVGVIYLTWLYASWLPAYLQTARHFSGENAGLLSALPQVAAFVGSVMGGVVTDFLGRRGYSRLEACRLPVVAGMVCAAFATVGAAYWPGAGGSLALMCVATAAGGLAMTCAWVLGPVLATTRTVATFEAFQNMGGSLGGALAPSVTGILTQYSGSFVPALVLAAAVGLTSAVIYAIGLRGTSARQAARRADLDHRASVMAGVAR